MKAINDLKAEHDAVRVTLRILDTICRRFESSGESPDALHVERLLEFFSVFVDKCHHGKEEELLFPALENVGISKEGGPIGVMLSEHQQGREYVRAMNAAVARFREGEWSGVDGFLKTAREYVTLLNQHIDKENHVLFPLAEKHLSEEELARLSEGFELIETQKIGLGKHDAFHEMIEHLADVYLK